MSDAINAKLTIDELNLILEALGNVPYFKVYALIAKIQSQAQEQINKAAGKVDKNNVQEPASTGATNGVYPDVQ